jgi:hypothetical protein
MLAEGDLELYLTVVEELAAEGFEMAEIAAAAARLARGDKPLEVVLEPEAPLPTDHDGAAVDQCWLPVRDAPQRHRRRSCE